MAVTALKSKISSRVSSRFKQLNGAFAAILADGSVVTWGDPGYGGDSSEVQDQLKGVQQIQATGRRICCDPGGWVGCDLGRFQVMAVTALKSKINSRVSSRFKQLTGRICCDPGGWVGCDLGRSRLWR